MKAHLRQGYGGQASMGSEGRRGVALRVLVGDERGRPGAAPGLARWLARVVPSRVRGSVDIAMVSDARIRRLNPSDRGVDCATDVLSFPAESNVSPRMRQRTRRTRRTQRSRRSKPIKEG